MLELRPSCELCMTPLAPDSDQARMCTYECTFCSTCAAQHLLGICPNCGGELVTRPRRPAQKLAKNPASTTKVHRKHDTESHQADVLQRLHNGDLPQQLWEVSFVNRRPADSATDGYSQTAEAMDELARQQPGFVDVESVRGEDGVGITVSRWSSIAAMVNWRRVVTHQEAQQNGRDRWYEWYRSDVARVDRVSEFKRHT